LNRRQSELVSVQPIPGTSNGADQQSPPRDMASSAPDSYDQPSTTSDMADWQFGGPHSTLPANLDKMNVTTPANADRTRGSLAADTADPQSSGALPTSTNQPQRTNQSPSVSSAAQPPWLPLLVVSLSLMGSLSANLFLGWSYMDARQKYRRLVRKTADKFRRAAA
jgi:hypothetical protein